MLDDRMIKDRTNVEAKPPVMTIQKWGGLASFLLAVAYLVPARCYLPVCLFAAGNGAVRRGVWHGNRYMAGNCAVDGRAGRIQAGWKRLASLIPENRCLFITHRTM
jgi:hypothetical protein